MGELSAISGPLAVNESAASHPVGSTYTEHDATYGTKKYIYLQADDAFSTGGAGVISETGLKAETVVTATLQQMPVIAITDVTDEYYSWFQYEGFVANARAYIDNSLATDIDTGDYLCLYAATHLLCGNSGVGSAFAGFIEARGEFPYLAETYYSCSTLDIYLRGTMGSARPLD